MIKIVAVGKLKEKALRMQIEEYEKRLRPFTKLEIIEVADEVAPQTNSDAENEMVKDKEGEKLLQKIKDGEYVILLDLWGEMIDSVTFANKLEAIQTYQSSTITFVIAGSLGPGKAVVKRANYRWKLSDLTFTHQMTRVLVLEQIYRGYMINHHNPYHK
ncbi:23S rRNA (pseudouridine(1915)-N(3))-methyltransferase RlmH [[Eubacterium] hominis]|uniref:23S rRNA (pseudouridine(1915)-N(3))-methyltransferase RlmH n=1 Tax=[Eubacterium] hominis TaxID=2764325 RepID=UPI003A4DEE09